MPVTVSVGNVFANDYRVVRPLSEGGMGALYVVEQVSTGSQRALKLMHPQLVQDARLRQRFEQEARVGARIQSDHVVQVIAAGVDHETGFPYLVMELLRGEDLGEALQRCGAMGPAESRAIFAQLCHALAAAHAAGIVHRDLKPDNIFLAASNREGAAFIVKVLDFGIAKVMAEAQTHATAALGTPLWMAPEQTTPGAHIGPQTDVWALGLIAFRMLTGRVYWVSGNAEGGTTATLMREILMEPVAPASQRAAELGVASRLPAGFDGWFARCVDRDPAARFADAGAARAALLPLLAAAPEPQTEPGATPYAPPTATPPGGLTPMAVSGPGTPPRTTPEGPSFNASAFGPTSAPATERTSLAGPPTERVSSAGPPASSVPHPAPISGPASGGVPAQPVFQPPTPTRKKSSAAPVLGAIVGAALLAGALGLVVHKVRSANALGACNVTVATAEEAADVAASCKRACAGSPEACATYGELVQRFKLGDDPAGEARASYQKGCDAGEPRSCRRHASLLERTEPAKAAALYTTACDKGDAGSCTLLGVLHEEGHGVTRDGARALSLFDKACQAKDELGCAYQAFMLFEGLGVPQDEARAREIAKSAAVGLALACSPAHAKECVALGGMLAVGEGRDEARAVEAMTTACDAGEQAGCANLGVMALLGVGVPRDPARGLDRLQKACAAGELAACTSAGIVQAGVTYVARRGPRGVATLKLACFGPYQIGCAGWGPAYPPAAGLAADAAAAVATSTRACDAGELTACVNLGAFHQYAVGTPKNREKASELFKKACDGKNGGGCGELGSMYQLGRGVPQDGARAFALLEESCTFGEKDSCIVAADLKAAGIGAPKAPAEAAGTFRTLCEKNKVAMACNTYAGALARGQGVPRDVPAAVGLLKQVCEAKLERPYPNACVSLGNLQETGAAGPKDAISAAKLYQAACDQGAIGGCTALARLLADGTGVPRDPAKALALVESGCKQSDAGACDLLGYFHATGKAGLPPSGAKGIPYFQLACDDASWGSCMSIGMIHLLGLAGQPKDPAAAATYLKLACEHGVEDACKKAAQLKH